MVGSLDPVHRRVGGGDERSSVVSGGASVGHADARWAGHGYPDPDADRFGKNLFEPLEQVVGAGVLRFVHDHELVAAQAGDDVGAAYDRQQSACRFAEHDVAGLVAVQVVDHLEVVEVEVGDGQRHTVAFRAGQICVEQLLQESPVGQSGQWVAQREIIEALLQSAEFGYVATHPLKAAVKRSNLHLADDRRTVCVTQVKVGTLGQVLAAECSLDECSAFVGEDLQELRQVVEEE